ncbi:peptidylprolyl isomerase [Oscillospiraceae bacterium MB08-C2-2]|nr:peptidylprolyl isomerase [Oscillospiraceae bacterium MB08-C2-2]
MSNKQLPVAVITMENGLVMRLELYPEQAPISVANFADLANTGYYDGLAFHRVVKGYVIQGGSTTNACTGDDPGFTIKGEFAQNGVDTGLSHRRGALSMARDDDPDSASAQFFIVHQDAFKLDGRYAAFGQLLEEGGFAVLDSIAQVPTLSPEEENRPLTPQVIRTIRVEPGDYDLAAPVRIVSSL